MFRTCSQSRLSRKQKIMQTQITSTNELQSTVPGRIKRPAMTYSCGPAAAQAVALKHSQHQLRLRLPVMLPANGQFGPLAASCLSSEIDRSQDRFNQ